MKATKLPRRNVADGNRLEKRLFSYGLAASALLAGGANANAAVQMYDFTSNPPTTPINGNLYFSLQLGTFSTSDPSGMSFRLRQLSGTNSGNPYFGATAFKLGGDVGIAGLAGIANRFGTNSQIGGSRNFETRGLLRGQATSFTSGVWQLGEVGFLGLKFLDSNSMTHYGWAEIRLNNNYTETLYAIAYETDANTAITTPDAVVPEPSELALLAMGAAGLAIMRKRRKRGTAASV